MMYELGPSGLMMHAILTWMLQGEPIGMACQSLLVVGTPLRPEGQCNSVSGQPVGGRSPVFSGTVIGMLQPSETGQVEVVECQPSP